HCSTSSLGLLPAGSASVRMARTRIVLRTRTGPSPGHEPRSTVVLTRDAQTAQASVARNRRPRSHLCRDGLARSRPTLRRSDTRQEERLASGHHHPPRELARLLGGRPPLTPPDMPQIAFGLATELGRRTSLDHHPVF